MLWLSCHEKLRPKFSSIFFPAQTESTRSFNIDTTWENQLESTRSFNWIQHGKSSRSRLAVSIQLNIHLNSALCKDHTSSSLCTPLSRWIKVPVNSIRLFDYICRYSSNYIAKYHKQKLVNCVYTLEFILSRFKQTDGILIVWIFVCNFFSIVSRANLSAPTLDSNCLTIQ